MAPLGPRMRSALLVLACLVPAAMGALPRLSETRETRKDLAGTVDTTVGGGRGSV